MRRRAARPLRGLGRVLSTAAEQVDPAAELLASAGAELQLAASESAHEAARAAAQLADLVQGREVDSVRASRGTVWLRVAGLDVRVVCGDPADADQLAAARRLCPMRVLRLISDGEAAPTFVVAAGHWTFYVDAVALAVEPA